MMIMVWYQAIRITFSNNRHKSYWKQGEEINTMLLFLQRMDNTECWMPWEDYLRLVAEVSAELTNILEHSNIMLSTVIPELWGWELLLQDAGGTWAHNKDILIYNIITTQSSDNTLTSLSHLTWLFRWRKQYVYPYIKNRQVLRTVHEIENGPQHSQCLNCITKCMLIFRQGKMCKILIFQFPYMNGITYIRGCLSFCSIVVYWQDREGKHTNRQMDGIGLYPTVLKYVNISISQMKKLKNWLSRHL